MSQADCQFAETADGGELSGALQFDGFVEIREQGERLIGRAEEPTISLGGLTESNSVTVALLLAWYRHARGQGKTVVFVDVPRDLRNIIDFSGLTDVLPTGSGGASADP